MARALEPEDNLSDPAAMFELTARRVVVLALLLGLDGNTVFAAESMCLLSFLADPLPEARWRSFAGAVRVRSTLVPGLLPVSLLRTPPEDAVVALNGDSIVSAVDGRMNLDRIKL